MRLLLDTHAFLWWISDDPRLSERAIELISEPANVVFFSAVSGWEVVVKASLGRVELAEPPGDLIPREVARNAFEILPLHLRHALGVADLPQIHRDPFDRMLVAQAIAEELTLISKDSVMKRYPLNAEW